MAAWILTSSELERLRLRATRNSLDQRWSRLSDLLTRGVPSLPRGLAIEAEYQANGVWTGLRGNEVERIERNRGTASVAPLVSLPDNLAAWLGYQEVWDVDVGRSPFVFRQASLTVHVGEIGDPIKPQLLRLEWPGLRDWDRNGIGFQSSGAGHPHWQFDLMESLSALSETPVYEPDAEPEVENFDEMVVSSTLAGRLGRLAVERMHFASAAPWWSAQPGPFGAHHLNAPKSQDDLTRWVVASLRYVVQELRRCTIRS